MHVHIPRIMLLLLLLYCSCSLSMKGQRRRYNDLHFSGWICCPTVMASLTVSSRSSVPSASFSDMVAGGQRGSDGISQATGKFNRNKHFLDRRKTKEYFASDKKRSVKFSLRTNWLKNFEVWISTVTAVKVTDGRQPYTDYGIIRIPASYSRFRTDALMFSRLEK